MKNFVLLIFIAAVVLFVLHQRTEVLDSYVDRYLPALSKLKTTTPEHQQTPTKLQLEEIIPPPAKYLDLKSNDGRVIQARILSMTADQVEIERHDGKTFQVPLSTLDFGTVTTLKAITKYPYP